MTEELGDSWEHVPETFAEKFPDLAHWEELEDRAVAIFELLRRGREWCIRNPDWNLAVNLNGMNNCVDVKVFKDNVVIKSWLQPEAMFHQMLSEAVNLMGATRQWYRLATMKQSPPDEPSPPTVKGESRNGTQRILWKNFTYCRRCGAAPGQQCRRISHDAGSPATHPHTGRQRFGASQETVHG
jgi:hypothetical protein